MPSSCRPRKKRRSGRCRRSATSSRSSAPRSWAWRPWRYCFNHMGGLERAPQAPAAFGPRRTPYSMPYQFVDEIVSLALDGVPRIEVAKRFVAGDDVFSGPHDVDCVPESMLFELMGLTGGYVLFRYLAGRWLPLVLRVPACLFEPSAASGPG